MAMRCGALVAAAVSGIFGLIVTSVFAAGPEGQVARLDPRKAIEQSEQAVGRSLGNYRLIDSTGASISLRDYRGKPLIISLVYTACSSVCPPTTQHLINAVDEAARALGPQSFNVLTVGFDARNDTPGRLAQFASAQGVKFRNWRLASADQATIEALLRDLGFSYIAVAGGFDHVTQTTIEPLKDIVYGVSSSYSFAGIVDRIKFICTIYDPGAGRYRIDYGLAFGSVIAALSLLIFGGILYREWSRTGHA
jgi:protein SCO1/2